MKQSSRTPDGIDIQGRDRQFDLKNVLATDWLDNDAFKTAFFNAMSISFPIGEKSFIDSVRAFEDRISDDKLNQEVKGFYRQEGLHSREHRKYNELLCAQRGYDLAKLEAPFSKRIEQAKANKRVTPKILLASTVGMEHITAIFADKALRGWPLENADAR
ncbi:MAG: metal-dependent hydrolase, partial [Pseudomonadales bacterium]